MNGALIRIWIEANEEKSNQNLKLKK